MVKNIYSGIALVEKQGQMEAYIPSEELKKAVNLALYLEKRPLLLMGEPGCGKTRLAEAVAYELHRDEIKHYFFQWHIKSTSKAQEGIYEIDYLQRLQNANISRKDDAMVDLSPEKYIRYGALYNAFMTENRKDADGNPIPNILLIDEIDKADIDFPNDLLLELDRRAFSIPEISSTPIEAKNKVIVFITSNKEKELPPAFLRRCLYHYIEFPQKDALERIIAARFGSKSDINLVKQVVDVFIKVRKKIDGIHKKPSTSELLDWYDAIITFEGYRGGGMIYSQQQADLRNLARELDKLGTKKIPFREILLKNWETYTQMEIDIDNDEV